MPAPYVKWQKDFVTLIRAANDNAPLEGFLCVSIDCAVCFPTSWSKKKQERVSDGLEAVYPSGDTDNLAKSVLDGLTKAQVWHDDRQVVELHVTKRYAPKDEIFIDITSV